MSNGFQSDAVRSLSQFASPKLNLLLLSMAPYTPHRRPARVADSARLRHKFTILITILFIIRPENDNNLHWRSERGL